MFSNSQLFNVTRAPLMSITELVTDADALDGSTFTDVRVSVPDVAEKREHPTSSDNWNVTLVNETVAPVMENTEVPESGSDATLFTLGFNVPSRSLGVTETVLPDSNTTVLSSAVCVADPRK